MGSPPALSQQTTPGPAPALERRINQLIAAATDLEDAHIGVFVAAAGGDEPLFELRADEQFNTASNTKIVTAAAALALLGPDFEFVTGLWGTGVSADASRVARLYIKGGGDPSLGIDDVRALAHNLAVAGVGSVGSVSVDDTYFDDADLPPHFDEQPREQAAFRAPINAAGLGFNSFAVHVRPNPSGIGPARIVIDPPADYLRVVERAVETVPDGRARLRVDQRARSGKLSLRIGGQIRAGAPRRIRRRVEEPSLFAASVVRTSLAAAGISVSSKVSREAALPSRSVLLAAHRSQPLGVLVRGLGKYSNNYMSEMLLKTISAETVEGDAPARWEDGIAAVHRWLETDVGLAPGSYVYKNGSGLFDSNGFSPRQMVRILAVASSSFRYGPEFVSSLAIGGADGTLSNRMLESAATRQIRAKTGTLAQVSALAGFASGGSGAPLIFAVFVNDVPRGRTEVARNLQDSIAAALVEHQGGVAPPTTP